MFAGRGIRVGIVTVSTSLCLGAPNYGDPPSPKPPARQAEHSGYKSVVRFGQQLSFGLEPVGIGVARKIEPSPAFGNEIGAHRDLFDCRIERRSRNQCRCFGFSFFYRAFPW